MRRLFVSAVTRYWLLLAVAMAVTSYIAQPYVIYFIFLNMLISTSPLTPTCRCRGGKVCEGVKWWKSQEGDDSVQEGDDSVQEGYDSVQEGYDSVQEGDDSVQEGYDSVQEGMIQCRKEMIQCRKEMIQCRKEMIQCSCMDFVSSSEITTLSD